MDRIYHGTAASCGIKEGYVKVLLSPSDFDKVNDGDIVVVHASSPIWTLPLMKAGALISELGGILCHTAIIARELGVACVVGIDNITKELHDNDFVRVDGEKGEVYVINQ